MSRIYETDFELDLVLEAPSEMIEIRNPAGSGRDARLIRFGVTSDAQFQVFRLKRYDALATHGTDEAAPTQKTLRQWDPYDGAPVIEVWSGEPDVALTWTGNVDYQHTFQLDPSDAGDDDKLQHGQYMEPNDQVILAPGTSASIAMPAGQAVYTIKIAVKELPARADEPTRTRPHDLGETLFGHARVASERSLSYLIHSATAMTSISGAEARHEDFDIDESGTASITYLPDEFGVQLAVGTANADRMTYRQRVYNPYNPGCQQRITFTSMLGTRPANQEVRVFYGDDNDGVGLLQTDAGVFFFVRTSTSGSVVQSVLQAISVDPSKDHLSTICFEWLGAGGIAVFVDHAKLYHQQPGTLAVPFMKRPNLPITCDIRNVGASTAGSVKFYCGKVSSEGADDFRARASSASTTTTSVPTTGKMMLQIRPVLTVDIGSITGLPNRAIYVPKKVTLQTSNGPMYARVFLNGTVTGSPSWAATEDAGVEQDVAGTFTGATGRSVGFGAIASTGAGNVDIDLDDYFAFPGRVLTTPPFAGGAQDTLLVVGYSRSGTIDAEVIVTWQRIG